MIKIFFYYLYLRYRVLFEINKFIININYFETILRLVYSLIHLFYIDLLILKNK